jgi:hypothetical protein
MENFLSALAFAGLIAAQFSSVVGCHSLGDINTDPPQPRDYWPGNTVASTASVVAKIIRSRAAIACSAVRYFIMSHRRPVMSFMLKPQHPASPELVETR